MFDKPEWIQKQWKWNKMNVIVNCKDNIDLQCPDGRVEARHSQKNVEYKRYVNKRIVFSHAPGDHTYDGPASIDFKNRDVEFVAVSYFAKSNAPNGKCKNFIDVFSFEAKSPRKKLEPYCSFVLPDSSW